jgi:hypothetical protein
MSKELAQDKEPLFTNQSNCEARYPSLPIVPKLRPASVVASVTS